MKALITDLDGTILPSGGEISPASYHSLEQLGKSGIVRVVATGRTLFAARKFLSDDFPIDYLVFSSGAGTVNWQTKEIVEAHHLSPEETRDIADYLWNYNINFTIQREIPDNHYFYYTDMYPAHSDYRRRIEKFREFGTLIRESKDIRSGSTQFIMILPGNRLSLVERVRRELPRHSVIRSTSPLDKQAIWLEIYPSRINKGTTCQRLFETLGISSRECAGIGNDYNDVDFLEICGEACVVDNAPAQLKSCYRKVSSDRKEGFSEFVRRIF